MNNKYFYNVIKTSISDYNHWYGFLFNVYKNEIGDAIKIKSTVIVILGFRFIFGKIIVSE